MKRILTLIIALMLIFAFLIPFASAEDEPLVIDIAGLLTDSQIQELQTAAEELSGRTGVKVVILTAQSTGRRNAEQYADDYYDDHFALKGEADGILMLISIEERDLYISTCGTMIDMADEDIVDEILDFVENDVRLGNYGSAFEKYLSKVDEVIQTYPERLERQKQREAEALRQEKEARQRRLKRSFIIAPIIGALVGLIPVSISKSSLTTIKPHDDASDYFGRSDKRMTVTRDIFLYTNTTSRIIQTENRVSSGGSSHSSHSTHVSSSGVTHGGHGRKF